MIVRYFILRYLKGKRKRINDDVKESFDIINEAHRLYALNKIDHNDLERNISRCGKVRIALHAKLLLLNEMINNIQKWHLVRKRQPISSK